MALEILKKINLSQKRLDAAIKKESLYLNNIQINAFHS